MAAPATKRPFPRIVPDEGDFHAPAHDRRVTSRIGLWLGIAFTICFVTGLLSHAIKQPPGWFTWPSRPVNLYRINQGAHVISGVAAVPLLFFKLWSVYPKLFARPLLGGPVRALERISILILVAAAFFELLTGLFNAMQNYPWAFDFVAVHYAVAWLAIGAIALHVAVKLPIIRRGLGEKPASGEAEEPHDGDHHDGDHHDGDHHDGDRRQAPIATFSRRGFLRSTWVATGAAVVATAGVTVPFLRNVSPLSWVSGAQPQDLPVNRTASSAGVTQAAQQSDWRLTVRTPGGQRRLSLAQLQSMRQQTVQLPIACVEGWSVVATWSGVRLADLLAEVGAPEGSPVFFQSIERGAFDSCTLPPGHVTDPNTTIALRLNGEQLNIDHGYPARLIAPSWPGELQTKWLSRMEVSGA